VNGSTRYVRVEPCTIDAEAIQNLLVNVGWPHAADYVQDMARKVSGLNAEADRWKGMYLELLARHERPMAGSVNYKPGPESDG